MATNVEDRNFVALKKIDPDRYEGKCVGLADGKVVVESKSIKEVMLRLGKDFRDKKTDVITFPKKNKILVL